MKKISTFKTIEKSRIYTIMKDILITGAYGGMGKAATEYFSNCGFRVFAIDRRVDEPKENIIPIKADITSEAEVANALDIVKSHTSNLFAIVHFAGIYMLNSLIEIKSEDFRRIFDVNMYGAFMINKTFHHLFFLCHLYKFIETCPFCICSFHSNFRSNFS